MATDLSFRISAIDNASEVANKVQRSFSKISSPLTKMTRGIVNTGRRGVAALDRVQKGLTKIASIARAAADRVASMVPGMSALVGVLGGAGGIGVLAERWGKLGFHLQTTSRVLGMSARNLQAWHFAAQRAGVSAQQFDQSVMSSQNTIRQAAFGANPQAMMLLNRLGVSISHQKNGDIDYQKTQADIMRALAKVRNPVGQRTAAEELGMGSILPMIQRGTYNADRQQAIAEGYAPSEDAIARAAKFRDIMFQFNTQMSDLGNTIGISLVPALTPLVKGLAQWLNSHRLQIAQFFSETVKKFADWITSVNWGDLWDKVQKIVDKFGGWSTVLTTIVGIKLASTVAGWTASLAGLIGSIAIASKAAGALKASVVGGAAASARPWWLVNPYLAGAGALLYSKNLNTGEQQMLDAIHAGDGKRHLTAEQALPKGVKDPKVIAAVNRFMGMGWTAKQASGIVANLMQESHLNPYEVGDNGAAYGIGQWHLDRQADFKKKFGHDIRESTLEEQEQFMNWEMRSGHDSERKAGQILKAAGSAYEAGAVVSRYDERPKDVLGQMAARGELAGRVYASWQDAEGLTGSDSGSGSASSSGSGKSESGANDYARQHIDALNSTTVAIHGLTAALKEKGYVQAPGYSGTGASGSGYGLPTKVNYQILGAMP